MAARTAWYGGRSVLQIKGFLLGRGRWELSRPNMHLPLVVCVCVTLPRLTHRHQPLSQIHELTFRTRVSSSHPLCSFLNEKIDVPGGWQLFPHLKFSSSWLLGEDSLRWA